MDELSYAYHAMTITEGGTKRLRIIFVAVKRDVLENYIGILSQIGIDTNIVEPAPISLIRSLLLKNLIREEDSLAIIEKGNDTGRIMVIEHGVPQFVREFQLSSGTRGAEPTDVSVRLLTEAKISLDYFRRQDNQLRIKEIKLA